MFRRPGTAEIPPHGALNGLRVQTPVGSARSPDGAMRAADPGAHREPGLMTRVPPLEKSAKVVEVARAKVEEIDLPFETPGERMREVSTSSPLCSSSGPMG
jgi:hypothetical protein